jgi:hypothetical protein
MADEPENPVPETTVIKIRKATLEKVKLAANYRQMTIMDYIDEALNARLPEDLAGLADQLDEYRKALGPGRRKGK